MNKIWSQNFEKFLEEARERGLGELRVKDEDYEKLYGQQAQLRLASKEILRGLPQEEQKTLLDYFTNTMDTLLMEKHEAYRLGYVDCVRLLQRLKLWEAFV